MSSLLDTLNSEKEEYFRLHDTLHQVCNYLNKSYNSLEMPANIESYYQIDDYKHRIEECRERISNSCYFLSGAARDGIDREIKRLNLEIKKELDRIEEERRREEEERKKAEEEAQAAKFSPKK